ncbi:hypothetical protein [Parendozoicomonas haliclonae]|uniref:Uncharacterized protein n=1 Tax=Parendozoicomonas haliclonae TaxID=1960125 RepID=A0A1X7AQH1_9GAMM|nr:hypothetical protein [Parendozoicomonas haliclonae]SMA50339.1 hypothetical protein EHSB41UT_04136 [Parendozoicomonas haliclonae]
MSHSTEAISIEELQEQLKQLQAENKALQADNPKRLKAQIKRLQEENRSKNAEVSSLKTKLKQAQKDQQSRQSNMVDMAQHLETLKILQEPHWESNDKSWAVYLEIDPESESSEQPDYNLRLLDRKSGCTKMPHMNIEDDKPSVAWPRMRAIPKEVKEKIESLVEVK